MIWEVSDLVFCNRMGGYFMASHVSAGFRVVLGEAGLPRVRFHDLGHTAATLMLAKGVHPKVASEMLGHSTIAITLDLYSQVTFTLQREAARVLDAMLRGDS